MNQLDQQWGKCTKCLYQNELTFKLVGLCQQQECKGNRVFCSKCQQMHQNHQLILFEELNEFFSKINVSVNEYLKKIDTKYEELIERYTQAKKQLVQFQGLLNIIELQNCGIQQLNNKFDQILKFNEIFSSFLPNNNNNKEKQIKIIEIQQQQSEQIEINQNQQQKDLQERLIMEKQQNEILEDSLYFTLSNLIQKKDFKQAIIDFDNILKIDKFFFPATLWKCYSLYIMQQYQESYELIKEQLENKGKCQNAWLIAGQCLYYLQKYDDANRYFEQVLKLNDKNVEAQLYKAKIYNRTKQYNLAQQTIEQLQLIEPKNIKIVATQCKFYLSQQKQSLFNQTLQQAIDINPIDVEICNLKAEQLKQQNK